MEENELNEVKREMKEGFIASGVILIVIVIILLIAFWCLIRQGETHGQAAMGLLFVFVLAILLTAVVVCFFPMFFVDEQQ